MALHEKTHRELEVEFDANPVERSFNVHDDGHGREDLELNIPIRGLLGNAYYAARRQQERETGQASPPPSDLSTNGFSINLGFPNGYPTEFGSTSSLFSLPLAHRKKTWRNAL
ncbi:hypothetical protein ACH5RR_025912 [Cinchona calisaya]|uniref:Uncharacterized protein n=1 Tax=Cinchona calisaya TaxID=153742 RepID=A0ABD2Z4D2_9GENT